MLTSIAAHKAIISSVMSMPQTQVEIAPQLMSCLFFGEVAKPLSSRDTSAAQHDICSQKRLEIITIMQFSFGEIFLSLAASTATASLHAAAFRY